MGVLGKLEYFPEFARPYFRVRVERSFLFKGVLGSESMRLVSYGGDVCAFIDRLSTALSGNPWDPSKRS